MKKKILIVGGTGYLGQHLLQAFADSTSDGNAFTLAFTHYSAEPSRHLLYAFPSALLFQLDLRSGNGFDVISSVLGQPDVVINCAAISVPRACENDPDTAHAINVPSSLVKWLQSFQQSSTLLIHLSTDQVYEGVKSFYKEEDIAVPVNVYGKTKVEAEKLISENCPNYAILRSSIIYGPQTVAPVPKSLPIQWIDGTLAKREKVEFFHDEFRCPIYVKDLVAIILALTNQWISEGKQMQLLLNAGGPDRVSRVEMAEAVAQVRGYDTSLIKPVSASSVDRGVKSPADISMDITRLVQTLNIHPVSFKDGVRLTLTTN
ncbi:RmlD-like substrate binding domain [Sesbania bispinosa]|nr:RmlD-like substrate binding domain [Sesbania bispinosa]